MGINNKTKTKTNNRRGSVYTAKTKVIKFKDLWDNYPDDDVIHINPKTKKDRYKGLHCAIHVSESLYKCGVKFKSFKGSKCRNCPHGKSVHVISAQTLANWLKMRPFPGCPKPQKFRGDEFKEKFNNKNGIIFFKDYWQRNRESGTKRRSGDHIDLWKDRTLAGSGTLGSFFRITIGIHWDGWFSDFELSKEVLFWEIQ